MHSSERYYKLYLLAVLLAAALWGQRVRAAVTLAEVKPLMDSGRYAEAVDALSAQMKKPVYAQHADYNKTYGQALVLTGRYAESIPYLDFAIKKGKTGAIYWLGIAQQHLYDFETAIQLMEKYKTAGHLSKGGLWYNRCDSVIAECEAGRKAMRHVQDVVVIDSLQVPAESWFELYHLGAESGRFVRRDGGTGVQFVSADDDYMLVADGTVILEAHRNEAGQWESPAPVASLPSAGRKCCPFLRSDHTTLYFASDAEGGLGGLDLYTTQYNSDDDTYYTPQRLPMPFNSPYNDYAMAIDETHQVGWWVTDRNARPGMLTVYLFKLDDEPAFLDEATPSRARIERIADTWQDEGGYADLVRECLTETAPEPTATAERIYITADVVYGSADDFRNQSARDAYLLSLRMRQDLLEAQQQLAALRAEYHAAGAARRAQMRLSILQLEKRVEVLEEQALTNEKNYRNREISTLAKQQ